MSAKILFGSLSLLFVTLSGAPYIVSILTGKTKPHIFTWIVWTLVTSIAAAAQYAGNAGPGAWASILSAAFCIVTALLAFKYGEPKITRGDWITFIGALSAIPLWYLTGSPLGAAIVATIIDACAYYPTFRKSYSRPQEEPIFSYAIGNARHITTFFAMTKYSMTTLFYPAVLFVMNSGLIALLIWRRKQLTSNTGRH